MAKKWSVFLSSALLAILCACSLPGAARSTPTGNPADASSAPANYQKITAEDAKKRIDEHEDAIIVDVRTELEYTENHIKNAILLTNESISDTCPEQLPDLDAEILLYCRTGRRSAEAAEKLSALGYTNIYDFGGLVDWTYGTVSGKVPDYDSFAMVGGSCG